MVCSLDEACKNIVAKFDPDELEPQRETNKADKSKADKRGILRVNGGRSYSSSFHFFNN